MPSADQSALRDLFVEELKDIYWAEKHLTKNLSKMANACTSNELRQAFENHLRETENQVDRLEQVFDSIEEKATAKKCDAMDGLVDEAEELISRTDKDTMTRDCALISAAQKVEHYEIATYGTLREIARVLNFTRAASLLDETLKEEKNADVKLTQIAQSFVNESARGEES